MKPVALHEMLGEKFFTRVNTAKPWLKKFGIK